MNRTLRTIVGVLCLMLGLELGTRVDELARWGTPITSTASAVGDIITVDSAGARGMPGARYRQFALNSRGLRGPEIDASRPSVMVLGASETFGLYEPDGKEYPRQLQDSLASHGCAVNVVNAALPGFSVPTLIASLRSDLSSLHASIAVLYPTPVQYLEVERPAFHPPTGPTAARPLLSYVRVVRRLRDHVKQILPDRIKTFLRTKEVEAQRRGLGGMTQWTTPPADRLAAYEDDLGLLIDAVEAKGLRPLIATHANAFAPGVQPDSGMLVAWAKFYPRAALGLLPEFDAAANRSMMRFAAQRRIPLSDVAGFINSSSTDGVFADFSHFTAFGSAKVAGKIASDLLRSLGCPTGARSR